MELAQLNYFRTVARTEHFTRAAKELHITQPSLSQSIANLERDLGVPLFDRDGKRIRLNTYGLAFLEKAEQILALADEAACMLQDMQRGERGCVRVGSSFPITPPSPVYYYQYNFFLTHPQVALSVSLREARQIEDLLEARELDLGISLTPSARPGITSTPLYTDTLGIIVGPNHPLAEAESVWLRELRREAFLCNSSAPDVNDSAHYLCAQAGFTPNILYEGESSDLIGETVSTGRGISFVSLARYHYFTSRASAPEWERSLRYVALKDEFCTRTIYLLAYEGGYRAKAAQDFLEGLFRYQNGPEAEK